MYLLLAADKQQSSAKQSAGKQSSSGKQWQAVKQCQAVDGWQAFWGEKDGETQIIQIGYSEYLQC